MRILSYIVAIVCASATRAPKRLREAEEEPTAPKEARMQETRSLKQGNDLLRHDLMDTLGPSMKEAYHFQMLDDLFDDDLTPILNTDTEVIPDLGVVTLGKRVSRKEFSVIYEIQEHPDLLIKYQTNCDALTDDFHPLIRDFLFSRIAHEAGVAMEPVYLSPPAVLVGERFLKTNFNTDIVDLEACVKYEGTVRFLVMHKADACIRPDKPRSVLEARKLVSETLKALKKLHAAGVVHGDVHSENLCMHKGDLKLIDFGLAKFVDEETDEPKNAHLSWVFPFFTPWQLAGAAWARRDDMYKALTTGAELMHGDSYWESLSKRAERDPEDFYKYKKD